MTKIILTVALFASQLFAAGNVDVAGRVTDIYGRGIKFATVELCADAECSERYLARTNSFGYFRLSVPLKGYEVKVTARGYEDGAGLIGVDSYRDSAWYVLERK